MSTSLPKIAWRVGTTRVGHRIMHTSPSTAFNPPPEGTPPIPPPNGTIPESRRLDRQDLDEEILNPSLGSTSKGPSGEFDMLPGEEHPMEREQSVALSKMQGIESVRVRLPRRPIGGERVPFDTYKVIQKLRQSGWNNESSEQIMRLTRSFILEAESTSRSQGVSKWELENEAYLFAAAISELRTEVQVRSRTDTQELRSQAALIHRETEILNQKLREDIGTLKGEIDFEMGTRKEDSNRIGKELDIKIADFTNTHNASIGDLRTEIEATKWVAIRRSISIIASFVVTVFGGIMLLGPATKKGEEKLPTLADLGVHKVVDWEETDLGAPVIEARVGEDKS